MYLKRPWGWLCSALIFLWGTANAQIVNIEQRRIPTDSTGWFGAAHLSFSGSKTTKSIFALAAGTDLEYKSKSNKDLWLILSEFSLITGDEEDFSNTGFAHLRYNRKLSDVIRWELFGQIQYNELTKVDQRILGGTGFRFKLTPYEKAKFYLGIAYMYEYQQLLEPVIFENNHRLSSYFSFTLLPEETVTFLNTIYAQPLLKDFNDYRISTETTLILGITHQFFLEVTFKYNYDSIPPIEVPTNTYYFINALELQF